MFVQLVLLGVCCSGNIIGGDPFEELTLQPLPEYTIPTDGVTMTCITSTESGRIFLGGRDGHLYELLYTTGNGWQSRCRKLCHTGGLGNLLSRCFSSAQAPSHTSLLDNFYLRKQFNE